MRRSTLRLLPAVLVAVAACTAATIDKPSSAPVGRVAATTTATAYKNWPTYGSDTYRTSHAIMPSATGPFSVTHSLPLDGKVYAAPIIVDGVTVVATENNTIYAFSPTYALLWKRHLGGPSPASQRPCGDIDPLGITGTPAYSATTGDVYFAPEFYGPPPHHTLYALSFRTGAVAWARHLDFAGVDQVAMQERGALLISGSRVYVPFGGLAGDCGNYKGRIISYPLDGTYAPQSYTVPTQREAGIWTPPGPVGDNWGNIYAAVGNGAAAGGTYDYSDSVLRFDRALHLVDYFSPTTWASDNANDLDLGSQAPAIAGKWIFSAGKSGTAYVLHRDQFGHVGGQVSEATLCKSFGGAAYDDGGSNVYVPCTDGIRAVHIDSTGHMHVLWHAATGVTGSPVFGGGRVWSLDTSAGVLYALDPATGATRGTASVGAVTRFASLAVYGHTIAVPTTTGLTVVTTS